MFTKLVKQFTEKANPRLMKGPKKLDDKKIAFCVKNLREEVTELSKANNLVEQADALGDIIYTAYDAAIKNGIDIDPIIKIIHKANMEKVKDNIIKNAQGKVMKPDGWVGPEKAIKEELQKQRTPKQTASKAKTVSNDGPCDIDFPVNIN